jgi:starch phosphorylase
MADTPSNSVEELSEQLVRKIRRYLITLFGRVLEEASSDEFYRAFCFAVREQIMINWEATALTWLDANQRMIFYLSMEYLPGRFLNNNVMALKQNDVFARTLYKTRRSFEELISHECDPGLGNGGLGRLASCFLDSLATLKIPSRGYGLRYQYGLFEQQLWDGMQVEKPDVWLWNDNPWEFRRDLRKIPVKFCGTPIRQQNAPDTEANDLVNYEEVWAMPFDIPIIGYSTGKDFAVSTLRLWSTKESPRNFELQRYNAGRLDQAAENTTLTDVLYPSDQHETGRRVRLKQEFLLVSASIQDIIRYFFTRNSDINLFQEKVRIQINDTHPALLIAELMRLLTRRFGMPWEVAWETTQVCTGYTNHTILSEALESWDQGLMRYLLPRQYRIIEYINQEFCNTVRKRFPRDEDRVQRMSILENNLVRMANLAIVGSHKVNGVAELHSQILKQRLFKDFYELWPEKFTNVTNGVTQRRWLMFCNPRLSDLITSRIGEEWKTDFSLIRQLADYAGDPETQQEFLKVKRACKTRLLDFLHREGRPRDALGHYGPLNLAADETFLFDVQVKRIHEYKRQLLNAIRLIMLYQDILDTPQKPRVKRFAVFAGKAAASYEVAKTIIRLIHCIAKKVNADPIARQYLNVVYVENYCVSKAEIIIPAADLSEQISTAGLEASGTGNMKFSMNGALTVGTEDGANIEMREAVTDEWWPFRFGATAPELSQLRSSGQYRAWDVYSKDPAIRRAIDALRDGSLASGEVERQSISSLYYLLMEGGGYGGRGDRYFILKDLPAYIEAQNKADALFASPNKWAEYALHNIAGMGKFSSDRAIQEYAKNIWDITPVSINPDYYDRIHDSYLKSEA